MRNQQERDRRPGGNRRHHQQAWAPYNFVPMPDKPLYAELQHTDGTKDENPIPQRHDEYTDGRHTGYFDVTLTTKTPLFVRGMLTESEITDEEDGIKKRKTDKEISELTRKNPNAFSIDRQRPIIPGSSLRGMIRTLVEIVTSSKMHFVSDNKLVYRAVFGNDSLAREYRDMVAEEIGNTHFMYPSSRIQGGYLQRGQSKSGWVIRPAQRFQDESFVLVNVEIIRHSGIATNQYQKTHKVYVRPASRTTYNSRSRQGLQLELAQTNHMSRTPAAGLEKANLVISGSAPRRHWYPAIYAPNIDPANDIPISEEMWDDYKLDRDLQRGIETRKIEENAPLFYLIDNQRLLFFGPTLFFRMPYRHSIGSLMTDLLRQDNPEIDYAEALFGYVSGKDEKRRPSAYAGRVTVTSATVTQDSPHRDHPFDETIIPKILSSPKPTTFQHYLEQPNGWQTPTHQLHHYNDDTHIRGHKLYWRQMIADLESVKEADASKNPDTSTQHTIIKPVRKDVQFAFKVHFENLTDAELGALAWVLTFDGDTEARHQLGMGKPFGLGVVKLEPQLVLTPRRERYSRLFDADGSWFTAERSITAAEQSEYIEAFKSQIPGFDDPQSRIGELMALVRKQERTPLFEYMQIEAQDENGEKINQYQGRPVLPYPSEVLEQVESQRQEFEAQAQERQRQQRHQQAQQFRTRIQKDGLMVGDVIEGAVFDYSGGQAWFEPLKVYFGENRWYSLENLTDYSYEAVLRGSAPANEGAVVQGRVIQIDHTANPVVLICEPVE